MRLDLGDMEGVFGGGLFLFFLVGFDDFLANLFYFLARFSECKCGRIVLKCKTIAGVRRQCLVLAVK